MKKKLNDLIVMYRLFDNEIAAKEKVILEIEEKQRKIFGIRKGDILDLEELVSIIDKLIQLEKD
jgi:hypothetical protein